MRLVLGAAHLGDWSWDARTDRVELSPRAADMFGVGPDEVPTWAELRKLLHPDDRERARLAVERAAAEHAEYSIRYRVVNHGRESWISASGLARYDALGALLGMYGVVQDVTNDRVLVNVDDAVRTLVDPDEITYTAARVLGEHLRVDRCAYAVVEDDEDSFFLSGNYTNGVPSIVGRYRFRQFGAECLRSMRAGEPFVVEDSLHDPRIETADRLAYEATNIRSVICVPIKKSGHFTAAMAVHMSTPRRWRTNEVELVQQVASRCWESLERARVEREREGLLEAARAANRAKDEFLAMLGHELRNPLAPIVTALQLMELRGDEASLRERTIIDRQVRHLTRLVDDLLDVSRIARGKVELRRTVVELAEVVGKALEVASPLLEERLHRVEVEVPRSGLLVDVDVHRFTQVVSNLLTNAAKYTPPRGNIRIAATRTEQEILLSVRDDGVGMTPEVLAQAFDLFAQGPKAADRADGGLGLGLSIVKSLVERHGGSVEAHSEGPNAGSEFVVRLPPAPRAEAAPLPVPIRPSARPPAVEARRVLLVDDNLDAAETLATWLRMRGFEVRIAVDGPEALRFASAETYDFAILDIGLPVMDGYELALRLRKLLAASPPRLIAVTGYGRDHDRARAFASGFDHHLVKPVDLPELDSILDLPSA